MTGQIVYEQGEILWMNIGYRDDNGILNYKSRPVLVVSKKDYNSKNNCLIVCPITSKIRNWDFSIKLDSNSMKTGSLTRESELRIDLITNFKKASIRNSVGILKDDILESVITNIKDLIEKKQN